MKFTNMIQYHPSHIKLNKLVFVMVGLSPTFVIAEQAVELDRVEVVGQAAQISHALNEQRQSHNIRSVVHSDAIGQLPDDNAAEALQRLPGVSVANDQGEGRFVTVRGLAPELNNVTINGTLIPSPEDGTRAVALDVLPAELVQSLSVVKTLTPDMDGNALGGTIEVETLSGFDHDGLFYTLSGEASHDTHVSETSPKVSGAASNIFELENGGRLGIAAAVSWQDRDFGSDNVEADGNWEFDANPIELSEFEMRDYEITRERTGFGLNLDYETINNDKYYFRSQYSRFKDIELRNRTKVELASANAVVQGLNSDASAKRELKDREETQTIKSFVLGTEQLLGSWTAEIQLGYAESSEDTPRAIEAAFETDNDFNANFSNTKRPTISSANSLFSSASNYTIDEVESETKKTKDQEKNIKFDLSKNYFWNDYNAEFKFGGKVSRRDKDNEVETFTYASDGSKLTDFVSGNVDYALGNYGPNISASAIRQWISTQVASRDDEKSTVGDYEIEENVTAAYLMNTLDLDNWTVIAGVRYEHTDFSADGFKYDKDTDAISTVSKDNDYSDFLPSIHARYYINDNTQFRMAYSQSVVRPTFEAISPGFIFEAAGDVEFGNPDLDPLTSKNIDFGFEHYMGKTGAFSAFAFYKDIKDFVYATDLAGEGIWAGFGEAKTFANGNDAEVYGIELAYTQKLNGLPSPWNGLIVGANLTFSESNAEISGKNTIRNINLPGQSKRVGNLMLGWENDKLSMRISTNYKSSYFSEVGDVADARQDVYVDDQTFVDISANYFITKNAMVAFEAKNITDEPFYRYTGNKAYNAQYEEYGPSYKLSFTLTNF